MRPRAPPPLHLLLRRLPRCRLRQPHRNQVLLFLRDLLRQSPSQPNSSSSNSSSSNSNSSKRRSGLDLSASASTPMPLPLPVQDLPRPLLRLLPPLLRLLLLLLLLRLPQLRRKLLQPLWPHRHQLSRPLLLLPAAPLRPRHCISGGQAAVGLGLHRRPSRHSLSPHLRRPPLLRPPLSQLALVLVLVHRLQRLP